MGCLFIRKGCGRLRVKAENFVLPSSRCARLCVSLHCRKQRKQYGQTRTIQTIPSPDHALPAGTGHRPGRRFVDIRQIRPGLSRPGGRRIGQRHRPLQPAGDPCHQGSGRSLHACDGLRGIHPGCAAGILPDAHRDAGAGTGLPLHGQFRNGGHRSEHQTGQACYRAYGNDRCTVGLSRQYTRLAQYARSGGAKTGVPSLDTRCPFLGVQQLR